LIRKFFLLFVGSVVSGLIFALSFPPFNLCYIGWVGLLPAILISYKFKKLSFLIGFLSGLSFYVFLLSWLYTVSSFFYLLLCVYLSIYWGIFFYLVSKFDYNPFVAASIWFFMEILIENLLTGFPWLTFSLSQTTNHYIWKLPQFIGSKGISFSLVFFNFFLLSIFLKKFKVFTLSLCFLIISFLFVYFYNPKVKKSGSIKIMLVQPDVKTSEIKNPETPLKILTEITLKNIKKFKPDIIIWPEGSYPDNILVEKKIIKKLKYICGKYKFSLILGTFRNEKNKFYNTALFLNKRKIEFYDKTHLVPYGEFIPGGRLKLIKEIFIRYAGYSPEIERGKEIKTFNYRGVKISPLICYENIFPDITNKMVKKEGEVFVVITNDSWFGGSAGPYQHFYHNVLRCMENGRYFIQCALSGVSGIVSEKGEIVDKINLNEKGFLVFNVPLFSTTTFYVKHGDFPLFIFSLFITGVYLCRKLRK